MPSQTSALIELREIRHFHLFAGLGGGARGFNRGTARVGNMQAVFRCIGGVDVSPAAIKDFGRLSGVPGTVLDLFDADQYAAFHGKPPPSGWRAATPQDIQAAAGGERPHIVFLSAPCKGFSGLLSETLSLTDKYQALNRLTLRGMWLTLEAFQDDPPELIIFENVPRIARRGRALLDRIGALLRHYGYAVAETTHDCGELGGLAQTRKRFLLVARHQTKVPPFLYEPPKRSLRAVGEVLDRMPLPGDIARGGPMHRVPLLQWQTWVRLAFVEAGSDWRSLKRLRIEDGQLADFRLTPDLDWRNGVLGVQGWRDPAGTVTGNARPGAGAFSVADPRRADDVAAFGQYGVKRWDEVSQTVIGKAAVCAGHFAVADPRHDGPAKFSNVYRVVAWNKHASAVTSSRDVAIADPRQQDAMFHNAFKLVSWDGASKAITGQHAPSNGAMCVADPRMEDRRSGAIGVVAWTDNTGTVAGESLPSNGSFAVADPRPNLQREKGDDWAGAGHCGVVPWTGRAGAVSSAAGHDNGRWSVADPRHAQKAANDEVPRLPAAQDRLVAVIQSPDGTWHRPFTTFELAALQSLVDPEEQLELDGLSDADWRERIGNAVPPDAATAIADTMGKTLLLAWSGESFMLSALPIWVRPIGVGMSVDQVGQHPQT
jgi:site-specific DNA-cytosine methylase